MTSTTPSRFPARRLLKNLAEAAAARAPSRVPRDASLVLSYHNVVPITDTGHGDVSLHLAVEALRTQLAIARDEAELVDLPTLLDRLGAPGRRIAVTFDDAYLGCLTYGLAACTEAGVVPTVFLAPALYGTIPHWDRAAAAGAWTDTTRETFLANGGHDPGSHQLPADTLPACYRIATLPQLEHALQSHAFHVGNHTATHANLAVANADTLQAELQGGLDHLTRFGTRAVRVVAFPFGRAPAASLRATMHRWADYAFRVDGGWCTAGAHADRLALPRFNVPAGLSLNGFRARLRGWR